MGKWVRWGVYNSQGVKTITYLYSPVLVCINRSQCCTTVGANCFLRHFRSPALNTWFRPCSKTWGCFFWLLCNIPFGQPTFPYKGLAQESCLNMMPFWYKQSMTPITSRVIHQRVQWWGGKITLAWIILRTEMVKLTDWSKWHGTL